MRQRNIKPIGGGVNSKRICHNVFSEIILLDNLFSAWQEFCRGKKKRIDVQQFEFNLEDNLFQLHQELKAKTYQHSHYTPFYIQDPKLRRIHKANIYDRVLHQAIFRVLYLIFDNAFIFDSYSCRLNKGTHRAVNRLEKFARKLSKNNHKNIFALKCDIKKFFDSVDQEILLALIKKKIKDNNTLWLIEKIIKSFKKERNKGLPLGNVTSQLFANIYLNELDQFVKRKLKIRYYLRYCDDFVILGETKEYLSELVYLIDKFLKQKLKLTLHSDKIIMKKYHQGIDFLGYVVLPHYRALRIKNKRRMFKKIKKKHQDLEANLISKKSFNQSLQSYFGVLKHCQGHKIKKKIEEII